MGSFGRWPRWGSGYYEYGKSRSNGRPIQGMTCRAGVKRRGKTGRKKELQNGNKTGDQGPLGRGKEDGDEIEADRLGTGDLRRPE